MVGTKRQSVATDRKDTMSSHSYVTRINRKAQVYRMGFELTFL